MRALLTGIVLSLMGLPTLAMSQQLPNGYWSGVGSLSTARYGHTATLLPDGQVLVVGGVTGSGPTASAELFDPKKNEWRTPAGSLNVSRAYHSASLLQNGTVLIAGGSGSDDVVLDSAELFDPATGTFTPIQGRLAGAAHSGQNGRMSHSATRLNDGRVLLVGGVNPANPGQDIEKSAEIFDPQSETFHLVPKTAKRGSGHRAVLLPDGQVLVAGGGDEAPPCVVYPKVEIYNAIKNDWNKAPSMLVPRGFFVATLLVNGQVLVAGGVTLPPTCSDMTDSAELYEPKSKRWTLTGRLLHPRGGVGEAAIQPGGEVLVAGGWVDVGQTAIRTASTEIYDPQTGLWSVTGSMSSVRSDHTLTSLTDGSVLVTGGRDDSKVLATSELFTP